jgi:Zn-dependent peptidase ImmA (M78 family)
MIKQAAMKLINKHRTNNPYEIASAKSIMILFEQLGDTLGYFNTYKRIKIIHINNLSTIEEQRFTCAHELGHVILHPIVNTQFLRRHTLFSIDRIEKEANQFAVELLMPDKLINEYKDSNTSIFEVAKVCGVPPEVVHLKRIPGQRR